MLGRDTELAGKLADNILYFGRVLRAAGLPVGPGKVIEAIRAAEAVGLRNKDDFYWGLHSVFVNRQDQHEVFNQAFHIVWRKPNILAQVLGTEMPGMAPPEDAEQANRRVSEAVNKERGNEGDDNREKEQEIELDASFTYSNQEVLQKIDFETMSIEEMAQAKEIISRMRLPITAVRIRRYASDPRGPRIDMRRSFRAGLRYGGSLIPLRRRAQQVRRPPLVVLCDISGSMSNYSRMFLHFVHAITNDQDRVHTFLFGTRLTNVTRYLRYKDVDVALAKVRDAVNDWSGGTRIGHTLREFNLVWSRRVLGQGALVLLVSDGLDRDAGVGLAAEIERLHKSSRRLIWLNPLLRYRDFEAKSSGIKVIIRHIDDFRPVHSLDNLSDLAEALAGEWTNSFDITSYLPEETTAAAEQLETRA